MNLACFLHGPIIKRIPFEGADNAAAIVDAEASAQDGVENIEGAEEGEGQDDYHPDIDQDDHVDFESGDEGLEPGVHSSWMFLCNSDSEDDLDVNAKGSVPNLPGVRVRTFKDRPEFIELEQAGLTERPAGCSVGVHPAAKQWRAYSEDSVYYGRSWGENRTPRQALLRVLELMLEAHCAKHKHDRFARKQLQRVTITRQAEPPHAD